MKKEEILSNLCHYDKRNPDFIESRTNLLLYEEGCYCDNCFNGRHKLAEYILLLEEAVCKTCNPNIEK